MALLTGPRLAWLALPAALAGHNWMPWLRLRGGKGLAVGGGALIVLDLTSGLVTYSLLAGLLLTLRSSDVATVVAFLFLPATLGFLGRGGTAVTAGACAAAVMVLRHFSGCRACYKARRGA